jgi:hypothetical protein
MEGFQMVTKKSAKKSAKKAGGERRELIDTGTDKRYVKRRRDGTFKESDDVGKSLAADRRHKAKKKVKPGFGDQGDQPKKKGSKKK